ncbi:MAG: hypothetical protein L0H36_00930 [bacterium]|nr:hypothetical protein [bacterium]MDN5835181.1 hypothetical protein [bacterium]
MATTKKTATKTTKRKPAARKPAVRTTARKKPASRKQVQEMRSLHVFKDQDNFISLRFTKQTLYWIIISVAVLSLGIWVAILNYQIQSIYDKIDASTAANATSMHHLKDSPRAKN